MKRQLFEIEVGGELTKEEVITALRELTPDIRIRLIGFQTFEQKDWEDKYNAHMAAG